MPLVLAVSPVVSNLLMLLFIAVAVIMILIILIQRPTGGGLSGAFGASSGGSGQTAFGAKTGDALTMMTIGTFIVFILTSILLVYTSRPPAATPASATAAPVGEQAPAEGVSEAPPLVEIDPGPATPAEPDGDGVDQTPAATAGDDEPETGASEPPASDPGDEPQGEPEPDPGSGS